MAMVIVSDTLGKYQFGFTLGNDVAAYKELRTVNNSELLCYNTGITHLWLYTLSY